METYFTYITLLALKKNWKKVNESVLELQKKRYVPGLTFQSMGVVCACDFLLAYAIDPKTEKWAFVVKSVGEEYWAPAGTGQYPFNKTVIDKLTTAWWKVNGENVNRSGKIAIKELWDNPIIDDRFGWEFSLFERLRSVPKTLEYTFLFYDIKVQFDGYESIQGRFTGTLSVSYDKRASSRVMREVMVDGCDVVNLELDKLYYKDFPGTVKVLLRDTILKWAGIINSNNL